MANHFGGFTRELHGGDAKHAPANCCAMGKGAFYPPVHKDGMSARAKAAQPRVLIRAFAQWISAAVRKTRAAAALGVAKAATRYF